MNKLWPLAVVGQLLLLWPLPCLAAEATLTYKDGNKWVAAADNKPLVKLLAAAKNGIGFYQAKLPVRGRTLAIQRLEVLQNLLERERKGPVVIEEVVGEAKANTVVLSY